MSSTHCIVVWEWQSEGYWLPHTPGVTRTLERAHAKKLTRVVLADADPALNGHFVNLRTLTQCVDSPDGTMSECAVRRALYDAQSAGARGVRWEWAPLPPPANDALYEPMPMEMQCVVEAAYLSGGAAAWGGWRVSARRLAAVGPRGLRLLRRGPAPPYPRAPPTPQPAPTPPPAPPPAPARAITSARRPRIPQQHTGSSVQSVQSVKSLQSLPAPAAAPSPRPGARSASPPRKHGLARQILHNLNIFSNSSKPSSATLPAESARSGRRHSVDTVSTYLSHESKDSLQRGSVGELLDCSAGSDDVFECAPDTPCNPEESWTDVGADSGGNAGGGSGTTAVGPWGAVCPACLQQLRAGAGLLRLPRQPATNYQDHQDELYIECLICGEVHDKDGDENSEHDDVGGPQPSGSMAWSVQPTALPAFPAHATIMVTYTFQSGVQTAGHPCPGAPYYAVGFPRHTLLPDNELGREVLCLLRAAWAAGRLFGVSMSRTTGREHVVRWRLRCAPPTPRHWAGAGGGGAAGTLALQRLRRALQRLPPAQQLTTCS